MAKFIIYADLDGMGSEESEIIECADQHMANQHARQRLHELAEQEGCWEAKEYSHERAVELGLEEASGEGDEDEDGEEEEEAER